VVGFLKARLEEGAEKKEERINYKSLKQNFTNFEPENRPKIALSTTFRSSKKQIPKSEKKRKWGSNFLYLEYFYTSHKSSLSRARAHAHIKQLSFFCACAAHAREEVTNIAIID